MFLLLAAARVAAGATVEIVRPEPSPSPSPARTSDGWDEPSPDGADAVMREYERRRDADERRRGEEQALEAAEIDRLARRIAVPRHVVDFGLAIHLGTTDSETSDAGAQAVLGWRFRMLKKEMDRFTPEIGIRYRRSESSDFNKESKMRADVLTGVVAVDSSSGFATYCRVLLEAGGAFGRVTGDDVAGDGETVVLPYARFGAEFGIRLLGRLGLGFDIGVSRTGDARFDTAGGDRWNASLNGVQLGVVCHLQI